SEPILAPYPTLTFLAAATQRVRLGTLVTAATFRPPALLVKEVTTLDVLSGGRAWLGLGSGYNEAEARAMGLALPPAPERFDIAADTLELARRMWAGDESPFHGRRIQLDGPIGSPRPLATPHPPVLVGGMGPRRTMRLVAEYADACNLFDMPDGGESVRRALGALQQHCAELGRPYEQVERTITTALGNDESADAFVQRCGALGDLGIEHVVTITRGRPWTEDRVAVLGEALQQLAA
ncbi:MAG: LLM class flavin-dependent oxidoreductase, partial [Jatrophihabitantaceae bacterium]